MGILGALSLVGCAAGTADDPAAVGDGDGAVFRTDSGIDADAPPAIDATSPAPDAGGDARAGLDARSDSRPNIGPDASLGAGDAARDALPDTTVADTGAADAKDAGNSIACDGLSEWFAGTADLKVKHLGEEYTCLVAGWCSNAAATAAYEPGKGWAWTDAWKDSGPCPTSSVGGP